MKTFYEAFEVGEKASAEEITAAWKRLMKRVHPDVNPGIDPRLAQEANQIYDLLSDPMKRAAYDAALARMRRPQPVVRPVPGVWTATWTGTGTNTTSISFSGFGDVWVVFR